MSGSWCENPSKITPPSSRSICERIGARLRARGRDDCGPLSRTGRGTGGTSRYPHAIVLVGVVALAKADAATIGVVAPALRADLHVTDAQLGLLAALSSVTGALCALPAGGLVDRRHRPAILGVAVVLWSLALGFAGFATGLAAAGRRPVW